MTQKKKQKKIIAFHLLNDFSGSPKVLEGVLRGLSEKELQIDLYTSKGGFLDKLQSIQSIKIFSNNYHFNSGFFQAIRFIKYQLYFFLVSFKYFRKRNRIFYINTLLPVGATFGAFLMNKKIVYHYHENADTKGRHYQILSKIMCRFASKIICVSNDQASRLSTSKKTIIPNSLPKNFGFEQKDANYSTNKNILMLSSLKKYKGILKLIELSKECPELKFVLVLSVEQKDIDDFLEAESLVYGNNLKIYSKQENVVKFYKEASVLLNLSNPNLFIETFGLTVIEAMAFGIPAIVPKVGGIAELVENGKNGFKVDVLNTAEIKQKIIEITDDKNVYRAFSDAAKQASKKYNYEAMIDNVYKLLTDEK